MNSNIKFNKNNPLTLIFYGGNFFGIKLAETVLREDGNVLIIDDFSKKNSLFFRKIKEFKNKNFKGEIKSIDLNFIENVQDMIPNIDFAMFLGNFNIKTQDEFKILENLENFFNITKKYNSKFVVFANINKCADKKFSEEGEHIKNISRKEITDKKGALIEIGDIYGEDMDEYIQNPITDIIQSIKDKKIIDIENLEEFHYYVYIEDAIMGTIKVLFSQKEGEYILANKEDISNISLAFRISDILKINVKNASIGNVQKEDRVKTISSNIEDFEIQTPFEEGLKKTILHKMTGEITNVYNMNKGFTIEKNEHREKSNSYFKNPVNIKNFDNIKDKYLKNEIINKDILTPERKNTIFKRKIRKKIIKYSIIIILYIAIIAPFILSFIDYSALDNNLKTEVSIIKNQNNSNNEISINTDVSKEIGTLDKYMNFGYFILAPLSQYTPTKNILISSQNFNSALLSINYNTAILKSFYTSSFNTSKGSILQKINTVYQNSQGNINLNTVSLNLNNKTFLKSLRNIISENLQPISNINLKTLNALNATFQMFSGKKYYTIIYLNTNDVNNISGSIRKYSLLAMYNGAIDNVINSPNAGDLNQIQNNTNIPQTSANISARVNSAFNITNTGVIYITKNTDLALKKILNKTETIENYNNSSIKKKSAIFNLLSNNYSSKGVIIYITDPRFQNINTLIY